MKTLVSTPLKLHWFKLTPLAIRVVTNNKTKPIQLTASVRPNGGICLMKFQAETLF